MDKFRQFLTEVCAGDMSYFYFWTITLVNINGFSPNLVCALILWTSALELLMGKIRPFFTEFLYALHSSIFSFLNNNLSKYQWIFTKLGMCIDIVDICFGIVNGHISSIFDGVICLRHDNGWVLLFHVFYY